MCKKSNLNRKYVFLQNYTKYETISIGQKHVQYVLIPLSTEGKDVAVNITPVDALHKKLK